MKKLEFVALLVVLTLIVTPTIVKADPWSALSSGYAVTTVPFPQEAVVPGTIVVAKAGTTDFDVAYVVFNWLAPDGRVIPIQVGPPLGTETDPDYGDIKVAICDTFAPDTLGDWGVQAEFWGPGGKLKGTGGSEGIIKIRATSFFVIPEVQMGTITILLTMLASLAIFARKKSKPFPRPFHQ